MAELLNGVTADGAGPGASHTGPCTVFVSGVFDGASVTIEVSVDDSVYVKADNISTPNPALLRAPGSVSLNAYGTYFVRCNVVNAGASTAIDADSTQ